MVQHAPWLTCLGSGSLLSYRGKPAFVFSATLVSALLMGLSEEEAELMLALSSNFAFAHRRHLCNNNVVPASVGGLPKAARTTWVVFWFGGVHFDGTAAPCSSGAGHSTG